MSHTDISSIWTESQPEVQDRPIDSSHHECDVSIVGAGIAGLTTALLLARAGKSVIILDAGNHVAGGETEFTTAHLSSVIDDGFSNVERIRGEEIARIAYRSHAKAIDTIEQLAKELKIDCDFQRVYGYLFLGPDQEPSLLDEEEKAAWKAGVLVGRLRNAPSTKVHVGECLRYPNQGRFNPLKYLAGIRQAFLDLGGQIFVRTPVQAVIPGSPVQLKTKPGSTISSKAAVIATNSPINDVVSLHTKQFPYLTYAISADMPAIKLEDDALYWDTLDPYHYIRFAKDGEGKNSIIVGGEDHKTGQDDGSGEEHWKRLEAWARERVPQMGALRHHWSGQVMETLDGLGYIGADPGGDENVFIATGDSGMGMTHGTIAGLLLTDLILGKENAWTEAYNPSRKPFRSLGEYIGENLKVAAQFTDWVTGGDVKSADQIPPGEGAVLRSGLSKLAVYKDESGTLIQNSATCPHLGCVVHWNTAAKTWDCPCHGSRFTARGKVMHGPSTSDLKPAEE